LSRLFCFSPTPVVTSDPGGGGDAKRRSTFLERMCAETEMESVGRRGTLGEW